MVFSKPRYPRYAIDLSHPAIRYAIAAAITVSGRYAATFPNNGPCVVHVPDNVTSGIAAGAV